MFESGPCLEDLREQWGTGPERSKVQARVLKRAASVSMGRCTRGTGPEEDFPGSGPRPVHRMTREARLVSVIWGKRDMGEWAKTEKQRVSPGGRGL